MAVTEASLSIRDKLRSRNIDRWHTVDTAKTQSVASHSHNGGIIAEQLLEMIFSDIDFSPSIEDRYYVLKYFQVHDLPELITGDLSSPFKSWLFKIHPEVKITWNKVEESLVPELQLISEIFNAKPYLKAVCKAADVLEAYHFIHLSMGLDEQHNEVVIAKIDKALDGMVTEYSLSQPDLNWGAISAIKHEMLHGDSVVINFENLLELNL